MEDPGAPDAAREAAGSRPRGGSAPSDEHAAVYVPHWMPMGLPAARPVAQIDSMGLLRRLEEGRHLAAVAGRAAAAGPHGGGAAPAGRPLGGLHRHAVLADAPPREPEHGRRRAGGAGP